MIRSIIYYSGLIFLAVLAGCSGEVKSDSQSLKDLQSYLVYSNPYEMNSAWLTDHLGIRQNSIGKLSEIVLDDYYGTFEDRDIYSNYSADIFDKVIADRARQRWNATAIKLKGIIDHGQAEKLNTVISQVNSLKDYALMLMVKVPLSYPQAILIDSGFEVSNCLKTDQYAVFQKIEKARSAIWISNVQNNQEGTTNSQPKKRGTGRRRGKNN